MAPWTGPAAYFAVLGLLCGVVGFRLGWRAGGRWTLPLAEGLAGFVAFSATWRVAGPTRAVVALGGWALGTTLASVPAFKREPGTADRSVFRAVAYREGVLRWLRTGIGPEARPLATARDHLKELLVYLAAAVLTGNLVSLVLGAGLLNTMNAYVARLLRAARRPWVARLLAWNVWSVVRVASYLLLGTVAAAPLASRTGYGAPPDEVKGLLIAGTAGVVLDLALKLLLSRPCGRALRAAVDLEAAGEAG